MLRDERSRDVGFPGTFCDRISLADGPNQLCSNLRPVYQPMYELYRLPFLFFVAQLSDAD